MDSPALNSEGGPPCLQLLPPRSSLEFVLGGAQVTNSLWMAWDPRLRPLQVPPSVKPSHPGGPRPLYPLFIEEGAEARGGTHWPRREPVAEPGFEPRPVPLEILLSFPEALGVRPDAEEPRGPPCLSDQTERPNREGRGLAWGTEAVGQAPG